LQTVASVCFLRASPRQCAAKHYFQRGAGGGFRLRLGSKRAPASKPRQATEAVGYDPTYGWVAAQFPSNVAFTQVQGSFPASMPEYGNRIHEMVKQRGGPVFALFPGQKQTWRLNQVARIRETASNLGITSSENGCAAFQWAAIKLKFHALVTMLDQPVGKTKCSIGVLPSDMEDVDGKNKDFLSVAANRLANYGYSIDPSSCRTYRTYIGNEESHPFQWCKVLTYQSQTSPGQRSGVEPAILDHKEDLK
jgi:hypothetical protein